MSGALVLVLPGVLCGLMAWDLSRPALPPVATPRRPPVRQRAAAAVLAVTAGSCLAAALWDTPGARTPGVLGGLCLVGLLAAATHGHRGRHHARRQAGVPAQRTHLPAPVRLTAAAAATPAPAKEPA